MTAEREAQRQAWLVQAIGRRGEAAANAVHGWLRAGPPLAARGLAAYRANATVGAERALAAVYPTVQALVGAEAFPALARAYAAAYPPVRGDWAEFGAELPAFIAASGSLESEPYLADTARLDAAVHRAARAADEPAGVAGLERLGDTEPDALWLVLRAGTALVASRWPVAGIRAAHGRTDADRFAAVRAALDEGRGEQALVWRDGWQVRVAALADADARCVSVLLRGHSLAAALDAGGPALDFEAWLLRAVHDGWLVRIDTVQPAP